MSSHLYFFEFCNGNLPFDMCQQFVKAISIFLPFFNFRYYFELIFTSLFFGKIMKCVMVDVN